MGRGLLGYSMAVFGQGHGSHRKAGRQGGRVGVEGWQGGAGAGNGQGACYTGIQVQASGYKRSTCPQQRHSTGFAEQPKKVNAWEWENKETPRRHIQVCG